MRLLAAMTRFHDLRLDAPVRGLLSTPIPSGPSLDQLRNRHEEVRVLLGTGASGLGLRLNGLLPQPSLRRRGVLRPAGLPHVAAGRVDAGRFDSVELRLLGRRADVLRRAVATLPAGLFRVGECGRGGGGDGCGVRSGRGVARKG